ncbi:carboxypeptidase regulatory-like domain-containing protein [Belliella sp. DSM 111904]|uniref:Carboxypeptidase regulatory-like domain-containing protein n=1 Tax=Belliella filtrata TaxID=2923435 RepID=A0ABS9V3V6_9BACT|nr:carboxypeptidase regulatory-like domain-containing protein [Belliella filtrata]MCH7411064.1 carboxypeptidase regulatory-like domain-containing protein [Belliella filtrata]
MRQLLLKSLVGLTLLILSTSVLFAQGVTTASMQGVVTDELGETLPGANIVAVHTPSGTRYGAVSNIEGRFVLPNLRVGGPYTVTVSFVGFEDQIFQNINLSLGQSFTVNAKLSDGMELTAVEVIGRQGDVFNADRTGASTTLSRERIEGMPTINRSINDLTRLTPQSNGTSFAGADQRYNNYTVDGNLYNNNFGLGSSQFAGGNPISFDAIEEVQVNIAPYDVRQSGFTGANVNAITKSGSNIWKGTAYTLFRNDRTQGVTLNGGVDVPFSESRTTINGIALGGPIIKDKLFFFVSAEMENNALPGDNRLAARPSQGLLPNSQTVSRVTADRADFVRDQMRSIYGYETGGYENVPFADDASRLNVRFDYNINDKNKLVLRYNRFQQLRDVGINGNSIRGLPGSQRFTNTNRFGIEALTFANANYTSEDKVSSIVAELNSTIGTNMANSLNIGYTSSVTQRGIPGGQTFPMIEILEFQGSTPLYYMSLGNELFTTGNLLDNKTFNITNNFNYFVGRHTLTAGVNFEYMTFDNAFNPTWDSWYRYNSYDSFVESVINRNPAIIPDGFAIGFSYDENNPNVLPTDRVEFGQVGVYIQDEFQVTNDLKITGGIRVDLPFYPMDAPRNERLEALNLSLENPRNPGEFISPDVSRFPKVNPVFSPRVGFNWDALSDNTLQVRGGTGLFTGRPIFVHLSNQINANGVTRGGIGRLPADWDDNQWQGFQPDPNFYRPNPAEQEPEITASINITDPSFKMPQTWRSNLAADYAFGNGFVFSVEGIYSRDYNTPFSANLLSTPTGNVVNVAGNNYPTYTQGIDIGGGQRINEMFYLTNINDGIYSSITFTLARDWGKGIFTSLAYTRSRKTDFGLDGGSQAASLWPQGVQEDRNNPERGFSRFDQPNRVVGLISFNTKGLNELNNTQFTLFYTGGEQNRFSYTYSGNFGDGGGVRLMYVPESFEDSQLINRVSGGVITQTAAEQWDILNQYIEQDPYLRNRRGQVVERNGAIMPWLHRFDLSVKQDIHLAKDVNKHKLQFSLDILNFGNMISDSWGVSDQTIQRSIMNYQGTDANGNAMFTINAQPGQANVYPSTTTQSLIALSQTWSAQVGVRYIFK